MLCYTGYINADAIKAHVGPADLKEKVKIFVCGPPGQVAAVAGKKAGMKQGELGGILKELGYTEDQMRTSNLISLSFPEPPPPQSTMDEFDSLVNLEQTFFDEGYKDGYAHGRIHGLIEGRALGREKGYEMWEELGYYEGFAGTWKAFLALQGTEDGRITHHLNGLLELISQFPQVNPSVAQAEAGSEVDILKLLRNIRSKYKLLCASLGVRPRVHAADGSEATQGNGENGQAKPKKKASIWEVNNGGDEDEDAPKNKRFGHFSTEARPVHRAPWQALSKSKARPRPGLRPPISRDLLASPPLPPCTGELVNPATAARLVTCSIEIPRSLRPPAGPQPHRDNFELSHQSPLPSVLESHLRMQRCPSTDCGPVFATSKALRDHLEDAQYHKWCFECHSDFQSWNDLDDHQELKHGRDHWNADPDLQHFGCPEEGCTKRFRTPANLREHLDSSEHVGIDPSCPFCLRKFISYAAIAAHIDANGCSVIRRREFNRLAYESDVGGRVTDRRVNLRNNISDMTMNNILQNASSANDYRCTFAACNKKIKALRELETHLKSPTHEVSMYKCPATKCSRKGKPFPVISGLHNSPPTCSSVPPPTVIGSSDGASYVRPIFDSWDELDQHEESAHPRCSECGHRFDGSRQLQQHKIHDHGYCSECAACFETYDELKYHFNSHGSDPHYGCPERGCRRRFTSPANLQAHLDSSAHVKARIRCPFCKDDGKLFISQAALAAHINANGCPEISQRRFNGLAYESCTKTTLVDKHKHPGRSISSAAITRILQEARRTGDYYCSFSGCGGRFNTLGSLTAHLKSPAHEVYMYKCPACPERFQVFSGLHQHVDRGTCKVDVTRVERQMQGIILIPTSSSLHPSSAPHLDMLWCPGDYCDRSFGTQKALDDHLEKSNRHRWCFECSTDLDSWDELNQHRESVHGYCGECDECFGSHRQLQQHKIHTHGYCSECDESYGTYDDLKDHFNSYRAHYGCTEDGCTRRFQSPSNLQAHLDSSAHVEARIRCPFCCDDNKLFISQAAVAAHIDANGCEEITRRRFNELAYECDTRATVVDKDEHPNESISNLSILRILQNARRTGAYHCSYNGCGNRFNTLNGLTAHLKSPAHEVLMYKCPECSESFKVFSGVHQHIDGGMCKVDMIRVKRQMQGIVNRVKQRHVG
ncbi:hypothetical protein NMY22_g2502 [Coprinellus aureogranulatus]|nr:hypothetical protein NMY22_g2502 [Coprinellus aureogranulatus]